MTLEHSATDTYGDDASLTSQSDGEITEDLISQTTPLPQHRDTALGNPSSTSFPFSRMADARLRKSTTSFGPYEPFSRAKGRSLLTEVSKVLNELAGAEDRVGPYAVLSEKNMSFVLTYFTTLGERNMVAKAWPPTDVKYKAVRAKIKDDLAPPPAEALFKDVRDRKSADKSKDSSRA
ncbi:hypothetical protein AURDEDRAFT_168945 [Auricularia subglabra TFB-10046 SS5]|nr:hypothetical protein AURDEDRAFT_168945 [Auricularia subglabra TFB-10046 SS5]